MSDPAAENNPLPVTKAGGFNYAELLVRVLVFGLLLACVGLLWWSYYRVFLPRVKESREVHAEVARLTGEVDDLDRRWSKAGSEQIFQKFALVQPRLFTDQAELETWLTDFRDQLAPLGMDIKMDLKADLVKTNATAGATSRLPVLTATITIAFPPSPNAAARASAYQRLLQLSQRLVSQDKSAAVTELTVENGDSSIGRAVLSCHFWTLAKGVK